MSGILTFNTLAPEYGDGKIGLLAKLLTAFGGVPEHDDGEIGLLTKMLTQANTAGGIGGLGGVGGRASMIGLPILPASTQMIHVAPITTTGAGTFNLYTSPVGKRTFVGANIIFNNSGGAAGLNPFLRIGGLDYLYSSTVNPPAGTCLFANAHSMLLEPGETLRISSSVAGVRVAPHFIVQWDASDPDGPRRAWLDNPAIGYRDWLVAGPRGALLLSTQAPLSPAPNATINVMTTNSSTSVAFHFINAGETPSNLTRATNPQLLTNGTLFTQNPLNARLMEGDRLVLEVLNAQMTPGLAWVMWQPLLPG